MTEWTEHQHSEGHNPEAEREADEMQPARSDLKRQSEQRDCAHIGNGLVFGNLSFEADAERILAARRMRVLGDHLPGHQIGALFISTDGDAQRCALNSRRA